MEITISFEERKEADGMLFHGEMARTVYTSFADYEQTDDFISFMVKFFSRDTNREICFDKYFKLIKGYEYGKISAILWNESSKNSTDVRTVGEKLNKKDARGWVLYAARREQEEKMLSACA